MESLDALIDRMVDGPLPPAELREAVARLDGASVIEGWRRCGLAFLEAQCWREAMGDDSGSLTMRVTPGVERALCPPGGANLPVPSPLRGGGDQSPLAELVGKPGAVRERRVRAITASWKSAVAAVILLALGGGLGWLGATATATPAPEQQSPVVATTAGPGPAPPLTPGQVPGLPADRIPTVREVARLRFGDGPNHAEIPILDGPGLDARRLMEQPPAVSDYQQAALRAEGYELRQDRRLLPVRLGDGRTAAVPIDRVRVRYVGNEPL